MNLKRIYQLYLLAGIGFVLALLKYLFLDCILSTKFFIVEILTYFVFLGLVYLCDLIIRNCNKEKDDGVIYNADLIKDYKLEIEHLNTKLEVLNSEKSGNILNNEVDIIAHKISAAIINEKDLDIIGKRLLLELSKSYEVGIGISYFLNKSSGCFVVSSVFGINRDEVTAEFDPKIGLHGQTIRNKTMMKLEELDEEYFNIESYSGSAKPKYLYILPLIKESIVVGLIEIATFKAIGIESHWDKLNMNIADALVINV